jgi:threonylcarbamoyladenosine tRNA methylthiotransferase MtaB
MVLEAWRRPEEAVRNGSMPKVALLNIGCKVNQAELEELGLDLVRAGIELVRDPIKADLCVLNTCTVTAESDRKCRKAVKSLVSRGARLVVAGCFAQRFMEDIERLPGVKAVITNAEKESWAKRVMELLLPSLKEEPSTVPEKGEIARFRARGFLKVPEGCERQCSYCRVPGGRGGERSLDPRAVLQRAEELLQQGVEELVICGTNLGRYSWKGLDLGGLVGEILALGGSFRVRLSSVEPEDLKEEWVLGWRNSGRVCPHLHLPLQSGSARLLRDMGRGYGPAEFLGLWERVSGTWPGCVLTTEVIVGYPGENDQDFAETVKVLKSTKPVKLHVFRYSPRQGTRAALRADQVDPSVKARRSRQLIELGRELRCKYMHDRVGGRCRMVVEEVCKGIAGLEARGTTEDYLKGRIILDREADHQRLVGRTVEGIIVGVEGEEVLVKTVSCMEAEGGS